MRINSCQLRFHWIQPDPLWATLFIWFLKVDWIFPIGSRQQVLEELGNGSQYIVGSTFVEEQLQRFTRKDFVSILGNVSQLLYRSNPE